MDIRELRICSTKGTELLRSAIRGKDMNYSNAADNALAEILEPLTSDRVKLAIYECLHNKADANQIIETILNAAYGRYSA
tara:strand:- start:289 stop:528 length:240 start_codon:yes stop_codon:yes gene_type:complete